MSDMEVGVILSSGEEGVGVEDYQSRDLHLQTSGCDDPAAVPQLLTSVLHHNTKTDGSSGSEKSMNGSGSRRLGEGEQRRMVDITRDKPVKVTVRVVVPVRDHPKFNFVGKLLGPKGNSLKRLQEDTMTKMAILGKGSMRDKHKEEELRSSGDPKFSHLSDDLHVEITAFAPPAEAHARIAYALAEVRRFLVPDYNDEIRQEQMWEMQILNTQRGGKPGGGIEAEIHMGLGGAPDSNNSTASSCSNGSMTPPPPAAPTQLVCRKRPLLPGGGTRLAMSPTKRTVLSILARARAAQGKELPDYHPVTNGRSGTISLLREDGMQGGNLV